MDEFLEGLKDHRVQIYMEDLIAFSKTLEEHRRHLEEVIRRLRKLNLMVAIDKTHLCQEEVRFVRHNLSEAGVKPDPVKIMAIREMPGARDAKERLGTRHY